ncbi:hypothetical protein [Ancylobacter sp. FA202]|uniref:hypothetical protein n=1 Tax=Ancylobacter sp. FA202 TaxID=1111106 RepID=UPI00037E1CC0|nr:hypothetical protein [Ancylobacter sp. FA202]
MTMQATPGPIVSANLRPLARLDLPGGGEVTIKDGHAFIGHMSPPDGTTILDIRDPARPRIVAQLAPPDPFSHTHKVKVAGDLMITNVERHRRHFYRKGERLASAGVELMARLGREPSEAELAAALGVAPGDVAELRAGLARGYGAGGFRVWDIADPAHPRELAYVKTGGIGVHRFDMDERFAYISTEMEGYVGNILVIYDLAEPTRPREVSRWHLPGQHVAAGETPVWSGQRHRLHHALRVGDILWAGCWYAGAWTIDVSDIARPRTLGSYNYHPPFPEPTHTLFRLAAPIAGRALALMIDEEHDHTPGQPHAFLWVMDASDPAALTPISTFHVAESASPYAKAGGRFGAHQFQERQVGSLVFASWFAGGLRVIDLASPEEPREIGHFVPAPAPGHVAPQSNDVDIDPRGIVALLDRDRGLDLLAFEG